MTDNGNRLAGSSVSVQLSGPLCLCWPTESFSFSLYYVAYTCNPLLPIKPSSFLYSAIPCQLWVSHFQRKMFEVQCWIAGM